MFPQAEAMLLYFQAVKRGTYIALFQSPDGVNYSNAKQTTSTGDSGTLTTSVGALDSAFGNATTYFELPATSLTNIAQYPYVEIDYFSIKVD